METWLVLFPYEERPVCHGRLLLKLIIRLALDYGATPFRMYCRRERSEAGARIQALNPAKDARS